jgi:hypothetical protein
MQQRGTSLQENQQNKFYHPVQLIRCTNKPNKMNKNRRKRLESIQEKITLLREDLELLKGEEQDYFDNMPENLQGSDKGQKAEDCIINLEGALIDIESACDNIDNAISE